MKKNAVPCVFALLLFPLVGYAKEPATSPKSPARGAVPVLPLALASAN
jgi:hypothetical protein